MAQRIAISGAYCAKPAGLGGIGTCSGCICICGGVNCTGGICIGCICGICSGAICGGIGCGGIGMPGGIICGIWGIPGGATGGMGTRAPSAIAPGLLGCCCACIASLRISDPESTCVNWLGPEGIAAG